MRDDSTESNILSNIGDELVKTSIENSHVGWNTSADSIIVSFLHEVL